LPTFSTRIGLSSGKRRPPCQASLWSLGRVASIICPDADQIIYVNMARWPLQLRFRQGKAFNLGTQARRDNPAAFTNRAFFVDWRSADRLRRAYGAH